MTDAKLKNALEGWKDHLTTHISNLQEPKRYRKILAKHQEILDQLNNN